MQVLCCGNTAHISLPAQDDPRFLALLLDLPIQGGFKVRAGAQEAYCLHARLTNQMTRVFKTLLLWLIIGAMPLQAIAAVASASCAPVHRLAAQAAAERHAPQANAVDAHSDHHDTMQHVTADKDASQIFFSDSRHSPASCNVGVACCVGAVAPPPVAPSLSLHRNAEVIANVSVVLPTGYVPAIPKRPPRMIIA